MAKIFVSHATEDKALAQELAKQITAVLEVPPSDIFVSSRPEDIPSGDWRNKVMENLIEAEFFIPVITPMSVGSSWVAFECGWFWAQKGEDKISPLRHPKADISNSPLNKLEIKLLTEIGDLKVFFGKLSESITSQYDKKANLDSIVLAAIKTPAITSADRQMQLTCKLHLITARDLEQKKAIIRWMVERDILHDAPFNWVGDLQHVDFSGANIQRIDLGGNKLGHANFFGSDLENAIFGTAELQSASFENVTSLKGANFHGATLDDAIFRKAHLEGADLNHIRALQRANFTGAIFDQTTIMPDGEYYQSKSDLLKLRAKGAITDS